MSTIQRLYIANVSPRMRFISRLEFMRPTIYTRGNGNANKYMINHLYIN